MTSENRKYFRFPCQCFCEVRFGTKDVQSAFVKNISSEGLGLLIHDMKTCPDSNVEIRIDLPQRRVPLLVSGEIKWSNPINHSTKAGVRVSHMEPDAKRDLLDYAFTSWCSEMQGDQGEKNLQ